MKQFHIFKDGRKIGSAFTREDAIFMIRQKQQRETHPILKSEFSIIEGEEQVIRYPSQEKTTKKTQLEGLQMDDTRNEICRKVLETPLEDIREDALFRADNFRDMPWYNDFQIYRNLGVCQPKPEYALEVQKALKVMGYFTHTAERDGQLYLLPGEKTKPLQEEMKMEQLEERKKAASRLLQKSPQQKGRER